MSVTIYHNPRCSKSRQTLALLNEKGQAVEVVEYLKTPPDAATLGRLLDALDNSPYKENTIVVFISDHGFHLGDKQLWGKHTTYEESTRAPLIFSSTGQPPGQASGAPVNFVDIFPTLCELTGLQIPEGLDGKSLVPVLKDSSRYQAILQGEE